MEFRGLTFSPFQDSVKKSEHRPFKICYKHECDRLTLCKGFSTHGRVLLEYLSNKILVKWRNKKSLDSLILRCYHSLANPGGGGGGTESGPSNLQFGGPVYNLRAKQ